MASEEERKEAEKTITRFENYSKTGSVFTIKMISELEKSK